VDFNVLDSASECSSELSSENTVLVLAVTPYQLVRHLTALITLADMIKMTAMVDSGAMGNFIHPRFVELHKLVTKSRNPLTVNDVNGHLLSRVDRQVEIRMAVGNHSETLTFDVAPLGGHNIVLGLPWLQQHDLQIHWSSGKVTFALDYCEKHCLAQPASTFFSQRLLIRTSETVNNNSNAELDPLTAKEIELYAIDIPECLQSIATDIPEYYHDYMDRFDGEKAATTLPNFRPDSDFTIDLDPSKLLPKPSRLYHMNQEERAECRKVLDEMLNAGWAEPMDSNCPIAAPMFFVWKKDGTRQPVIDYRKLNDITIKDSYPLLCIDEMMDRIHRSEIFMKFDLKSSYNQVRIRPGDEWKTTFMTPFSPFQLRVMTFGFTNAPPCFQCLMDKVFALLLYKNLENYLDDALNHHRTLEEHIAGVCQMLQCLREANLFCNLKKCKFHQLKIEFLGVDISRHGFEMDEKKTSVIAEWQNLMSVCTSGTLIQGLSGPNLPSRFTPLKGSTVSSQQSAVNIDADGRLHLATLMAPYEQALRAAIIFVYIIGSHE